MQEICELIGRFFEKSAGAFERNMMLSEELKVYGIQAVEEIFDEFWRRREAGTLDFHTDSGWALFHLLSVVRDFAKPEHVDELLQILLWEEALLACQCRSIRSILLVTIRSVGDKNVVPWLEKYAEKVKRVKYEDYHVRNTEVHDRMIPASYYYDADQKEVAEVIAVCEQR